MDDNQHNPKYVQAQKEGKVDYSCVPWRVIHMLAQAMEEGAEKYGRFNYREDDIEARTYIAAICRHLFGDPTTDTLGWVNGEDIDPDSDLPHLIKVMACCLLVEDARLHGKLIDNRLEQESKTPPAMRGLLVGTMPKDDHAPYKQRKLICDHPDDEEGPWEIRFTQSNDKAQVLGQETRGPYETIGGAKLDALANPWNLPGNISIHKSSLTIR